MRAASIFLFKLLKLSCFADIRVDSKCYASYLQLNCDSPPNGVISIDWNATFFGQSVCMPDCGCNGETTCMVKVQNTSRIDCMPVTDYETVTYRCVPPDINSTAAPTLDPTTGGQTERWTNPGRYQTTNHEIIYTHCQVNKALDRLSTWESVPPVQSVIV